MRLTGRRSRRRLAPEKDVLRKQSAHDPASPGVRSHPIPDKQARRQQAEATDATSRAKRWSGWNSGDACAVRPDHH